MHRKMVSNSEPPTTSTKNTKDEKDVMELQPDDAIGLKHFEPFKLPKKTTMNEGEVCGPKEQAGSCYAWPGGITIFSMGSNLVSGGGSYFHRWFLCLPMLAIVQSAGGCNTVSLLLTLLFLVCFSKWSPHGKLWQVLACVLNFLRYRRVEKHCDDCELLLVDQLNGRAPGSSAGDGKANQDLVIMPQLIGWRLRTLRKLPWRIFSRNWGRFANTRLYPHCLNTLLIWIYAKGFGCNLDEAEFAVGDYATLGDFFTRRLKKGLRPIDAAAPIVSPADGTVSYFGRFEGGYLEQVKGVHYSLAYFLGLDIAASQQCKKGQSIHASVSGESVVTNLLHHKDGDHVLMQMVIYLSPKDYHRFHSPADWTVKTKRHFPGELFSVKPAVAGCLPGLLHLNERVVWTGEWEHGFYSMVAVAATNVGDIIEEGVDQSKIKTNRALGLKKNCTFRQTCARSGKRFLYFSEAHYDSPKRCEKGSPFGHFNFGSTIVMLFEAPKRYLNSNFTVNSGTSIKVGQPACFAAGAQ